MGAQLNESSAVAQGMYDPRFEHDNCGIGAVVNIKGVKSHATVENALKIVENQKHRAGKNAGSIFWLWAMWAARCSRDCGCWAVM